MPRPKRCRRIHFQPGVAHFKPAGTPLADITNMRETILTFEELEAIRLKDYEELEQKEAAKKMDISQPTFQRLLKTARKKVAEALINGNAIKIQGGNFKMVQQKTGRGMGYGGPASTCKCPQCNHEEPKQRGIPCTSKKCSKCNGQMIRGE